MKSTDIDVSHEYNTSDELTNREIIEFYLDWIRSETNNPYLTGEEGGVKLALNLLNYTDPFEIVGYSDIVQESIDNITHTYQTNDEGVPLKVLRWIKPYYMLGSVSDEFTSL